jgi:hypothetical protein
MAAAVGAEADLAGYKSKRDEKRRPATRLVAFAMVIMTTPLPITLSLPVALNEEEARQLAESVETIQRGMGTFLEVGRALMRIRDLRLYRNLAPNFEAFCSKALGLTKQHCYNYIACSDVFEVLEARPEFAGRLPQNEAQTRPLRSLDAATVVEVWAEVVEKSAQTPITAALVRAAAQKRVPENGAGENPTGGKAPEIVARLKRGVQSLRKALESAGGEYSGRGVDLLRELEALLSDHPTP